MFWELTKTWEALCGAEKNLESWHFRLFFRRIGDAFEKAYGNYIHTHTHIVGAFDSFECVI